MHCELSCCSRLVQNCRRATLVATRGRLRMGFISFVFCRPLRTSIFALLALYCIERDVKVMCSSSHAVVVTFDQPWRERAGPFTGSVCELERFAVNFEEGFLRAIASRPSLTVTRLPRIITSTPTPLLCRSTCRTFFLDPVFVIVY